MKFCQTLPYYRRGSPGKSRFERENRFGRGGVFFLAGFVLLFLTIVPIIKYILELSFSQENNQFNKVRPKCGFETVLLQTVYIKRSVAI